MIIVMQTGASEAELAEVLRRIEELGYTPHVIHGTTRNVIGAIGDERGKARLQYLEALSGVERVVPILSPYKLASIEVKKTDKTLVRVGKDGVIGGKKVIVIAG